MVVFVNNVGCVADSISIGIGVIVVTPIVAFMAVVPSVSEVEPVEVRLLRVVKKIVVKEYVVGGISKSNSETAVVDGVFTGSVV